MKRGRLILFSGPSGVGKGTIRNIFSQNKSLNLDYSVSYTTRKQRTQEIHGKDYFFVSKSEFMQRINSGDLVEWAQFSGNYYGTSALFINKLLNKGKNVILEIEVVGAKIILEKFPNCLSIFLLPPSLVYLEKRLQKRATETVKSIKMRLKRAKYEMTLVDLYDYSIVNWKVNTTAQKISEIILQEIRD